MQGIIWFYCEKPSLIYKHHKDRIKSPWRHNQFGKSERGWTCHVHMCRNEFCHLLCNITSLSGKTALAALKLRVAYIKNSHYVFYVDKLRVPEWPRSWNEWTRKNLALHESGLTGIALAFFHKSTSIPSCRCRCLFTLDARCWMCHS